MSISTLPERQPIPTRRSGLVGRLLPPLVVSAVALAVWQIYVEVAQPRPQVLPSPGRIAQQGWLNRDILFEHTMATLQVTILGFSISLICAGLLATVMDFVSWLRRAFVPLLVVSQTLPIAAIAPLMIIWFGFGTLPKVLVVVLVTFFPMTVGLVEGYSSADRDAISMVRGMGAGRWTVFRLIRLPSAMPRFFTSLRIGITYAVVGAVFAEYVGAERGLGVYMSQQKNSFRTDLVLAAVAVCAVVSVTLFALTYLVQRAVAPWIERVARAGAYA